MTLIDEIRKDIAMGSPGKWDGRQVHGTMPTDVCKYGVISLETGLETARIWNLSDAYRVARVPQIEEALLAAEELADALEDAKSTLKSGTLREKISGNAKLTNALTAFRAATKL